MANANAKNQAAQAAQGGVDTSVWEKRAVGFAPYWAPDESAEENVIVAEVVGWEDADPNIPESFARFHMCALAPLTAMRGSGQNAKEVEVKVGERFTMSEYKQILGEMNLYLWCFLEKGFKVPVKFTAKDKSPTKKPGRKVWNWDLRTNPSVSAKLAEAEREYNALNSAGGGRMVKGAAGANAG